MKTLNSQLSLPSRMEDIGIYGKDIGKEVKERYKPKYCDRNCDKCKSYLC